MALKVLLADASVPAQNMGKKILLDAGYEVVVASNGLEAQRKIADSAPNLVILDIFLPGYNGLELCARLRASRITASMPVILSVGKMEPYRPEDGEQVGADAVLVKPFAAAELTAAVRKLIGSPEPSTAKPSQAKHSQAETSQANVTPLPEAMAATESAIEPVPEFPGGQFAVPQEAPTTENPAAESLLFDPAARRTSFTASTASAFAAAAPAVSDEALPAPEEAGTQAAAAPDFALEPASEAHSSAHLSEPDDEPGIPPLAAVASEPAQPQPVNAPPPIEWWNPAAEAELPEAVQPEMVAAEEPQLDAAPGAAAGATLDSESGRAFRAASETASEAAPTVAVAVEDAERAAWSEPEAETLDEAATDEAASDSLAALNPEAMEPEARYSEAMDTEATAVTEAASQIATQTATETATQTIDAPPEDEAATAPTETFPPESEPALAAVSSPAWARVSEATSESTQQASPASESVAPGSPPVEALELKTPEFETPEPQLLQSQIRELIRAQSQEVLLSTPEVAAPSNFASAAWETPAEEVLFPPEPRALLSAADFAQPQAAPSPGTDLPVATSPVADASPDFAPDSPAEAGAAPGHSDAERVRQAVETVLDRFRPLLVAAIVRELAGHD